jgi:glutathione S-transferase
MPQLELTVLSLRYSSWSMRPWLALTHAGAAFTTRTVELPPARPLRPKAARQLCRLSN